MLGFATHGAAADDAANAMGFLVAHILLVVGFALALRLSQTRGHDFFLMTGMLLGARGVIGSPLEYFGNPDRIFEFQSMSDEERRQLMQLAIDIKQVNSYLGTVPAPYKAGLNMIGLPAGYTRDPLRPLTPEEEAKLRSVLVKWGAPVKEAAPVRAAE